MMTIIDVDNFVSDNWETCPQLRELNEAEKRQLWRERIYFANVKVGRMRVVGVAAHAAPQRHGARMRWVVQCECGRYEYRRTSVIRQCIDSRDRDRQRRFQCNRCSLEEMGTKRTDRLD